MVVPNSILLKSARQIPNATIFTDASYDPELKIGSWACYIRIGKRVIQPSSIIKTEVGNSTEAERVGVATALWIVNKVIDIKKYKLIIYCDNGAAAKPVTLANKTGKDKQNAKVQLEFYQKNIEPLLQKALLYDIRYIKGHASRSKHFKLQTKHVVNDMVDKEAKRILNEYRREHEDKSTNQTDSL